MRDRKFGTLDRVPINPSMKLDIIVVVLLIVGGALFIKSVHNMYAKVDEEKAACVRAGGVPQQVGRTLDIICLKPDSIIKVQ